jgi:hypothetical protein
MFKPGEVKLAPLATEIASPLSPKVTSVPDLGDILFTFQFTHYTITKVPVTVTVSVKMLLDLQGLQIRIQSFYQ